MIRGEAGIGKTTLLRTFVDQLVDRDATASGGATCAEALAGCEPYRPLLDVASMLCTPPLDPDAAMLRRHAPSWWSQFPALHDQADASPQPAGGVTSVRMSRELTDYLEALAAVRTLVLWIDDVQWADTLTLDWLSSFMARVQTARVLVIVTLRGDHQTAAHLTLAQLECRSSCHAVTLTGLDVSAVADMVRRAYGDGASLGGLATRLHARTEGHPLFVSLLAHELSRSESAARQPVGQPSTPSSGSEEPDLPMSVRLQAAIEAHIAHLDQGETELLEIASLIGGTSWPAPLIAAAADRAVLDVEDALTRLARRANFIRHVGSDRWPDGTACEVFAFRHALHRDALRARVGAYRNAVLSARIARRLETAFGTRAREHALRLAMHFEAAGEAEKAMTYLLEAAGTANRLGAVQEAAQHLRRALVVLGTRPASPDRDEREAPIQVRLGAALMAARGWGASGAEEAYTRALELCEQQQDHAARFPIYWGLWLFRWGRGELGEAQALVERLARVAGDSADGMVRLQLLHARWATAFCLGELDAALAHATQGAAVASEVAAEPMLAFGNHHAAVCAYAFAARARATRGEADAARADASEAVTRARAFSHPFTLALALVFAAATRQLLSETEPVRQLAEEAEALSVEHGFTLMQAWARALIGWARRDTNGPEAADLVQSAVTAATATGSRQFHTWLLGLLAETHLAAGQLGRGADIVDQALAYARATGERFYMRHLEHVRIELTTRARGCPPGST